MRMCMQDPKDYIYNVCPLGIVITFTSATQILVVYGTAFEDVAWSLMGNTYSWTAVLVMLLWAYTSLLVPGQEYFGPATSSGFIPKYRANGIKYFGVTMLTYIILLLFNPQIAVDITKNFPQIVASCNIVAFFLCLFLYHKGRNFPDVKEDILEPQSFISDFYRGIELHPRLMGVDVKQLTNCRFGLMAWFLLIITFFVTSWVTEGFNLAFFLCITLQTIYLTKFYCWETGYFNTLDITLDRAGYYLCWGCIVWVPCFYTFTSYFLVSRQPYIGNNGAWLIFFFGIISTVLNYRVDWEKEYFRKNNGRCHIWGKPATFIVASFQTHKGSVRKTQLLTSGFWGIARHLNYLFEIMVALSWSLPALGYGICPFLYPIFLTVLLVHRIFRDETKCQVKYGKAWEEYCQNVPYRLIPYIF